MNLPIDQSSTPQPDPNIMTQHNVAKDHTPEQLHVLVADRPNTRHNRQRPVRYLSGQADKAPAKKKSLPHTINKCRALQQKLGDCRRSALMNINTTDGGIVVTCTPPYYELLKNGIANYIDQCPKLSLISETPHVDGDGATQSTVLKVRSGRFNCTLNLHHTTSRIVINGKSARKFVEDHFPALNAGIKDNLEKQNISISDLNTQLRTLLELALSNTGSSTRVAASDLDHETLALMSNQCVTPPAVILRETEPDDVLCPLCRFPAAGDTIQCDICNSWLHRACENLDNKTYNNYMNNSTSYSCSLCKSNTEVAPAPNTLSSTAILPLVGTLPEPTLAAAPVAPALATAPTPVPLAVVPSVIAPQHVYTPPASMEQHPPKGPRKKGQQGVTLSVNTATAPPTGTQAEPPLVAPSGRDPHQKRLQQWEKELKKRETGVVHSERQAAAQRSTISNLEERLKQTEQSNRMLKLHLATSEADTTRPPHEMPRTNYTQSVPPPISHSSLAPGGNVNTLDALHQQLRDQSLRTEIELLRHRMDQISANQQIYQQHQSMHQQMVNFQQLQSLQMSMHTQHSVGYQVPRHPGYAQPGPAIAPQWPNMPPNVYPPVIPHHLLRSFHHPGVAANLPHQGVPPGYQYPGIPDIHHHPGVAATLFHQGAPPGYQHPGIPAMHHHPPGHIHHQQRHPHNMSRQHHAHRQSRGNVRVPQQTQARHYVQRPPQPSPLPAEIQRPDDHTSTVQENTPWEDTSPLKKSLIGNLLALDSLLQHPDNATNEACLPEDSPEPHDDACQHVSLRDDMPPYAASHARHTGAPILINPPDSDTRDHSSPSPTPSFLDLTGLIRITT